jgi:hypothetical protein
MYMVLSESNAQAEVTLIITQLFWDIFHLSYRHSSSPSAAKWHQ